MPIVAPVQLSAEAVRVGGRSRILLCASVFYFRIPRPLWKERLNALKAAGYDCVDVYFPWNYHEPSEGDWRFGGERDAEAFLIAVKEAGMLTVARPGPYICSEWDGGALPAYLLAKENMRLRDNDPAYLSDVARWFDRILPILSRQQLSEGGSVVSVQLENELDFYGCEDPAGYIGALRDMALAHGIVVPLIACAGQGGLFEASGDVDGVVPTCNFYPNDRDPEFEDKVLGYRNRLAERGLPLLVTETNRSHFLLRRLLSCGAKLLGPYLQVSGTDFGFTNATNNWGEPLAFMTSDYDFGGMISPEGRVRPEAYEGLLLSRLIEAYGEPLAEAVPDSGEPIVASADGTNAGILGPTSLRLKNGGRLLFLHHAGERDASFRLNFADGRSLGVGMRPGASVALPADLPLGAWHCPATLAHSSAELYMSRTDDTSAAIALHSDGEGELAFRASGSEAVRWEAEGAILQEEGDLVRVVFGDHRPVTIRAEMPDGTKLTLTIVDRATALSTEVLDPQGEVRMRREPEEYAQQPASLELNWTACGTDPSRPFGQAAFLPVPRAEFLEKQGVYRGFAWYAADYSLSAGATLIGWLVRRASDLVSLYANGAYVGTAVPGGSDRYFPASGSPGGTVTARTEIWGHSNFEDMRLPALRLSSMKGLRDIVAVHAEIPLTGNWRTAIVAESDSPERLADPGLDDRSWPVVGFGGWLSGKRPVSECFRRTFKASTEATSWTVRFEDLQGLVRLFVNGRDAGAINLYDPFADITAFVVPGEETLMAVFLDRTTEAGAGEIVVYEGNSGTNWRLASAEEQELADDALRLQEGAVTATLPYRLEPGGIGWLFADIPPSPSGRGWRIRIAGTGVKLSAMFQGRLVSRLWLPGGEERPRMRGGDPGSLWLPGVWFDGREDRLSLLLEAVDREGDCLVERMDFVPA